MGYYLRDATSLSFSYSPAVPGHLLFAIAIDAGGDFGGGIWSCDLDYKSGVNSSDFISKDGVHRDGWTTAHLQEGKEGIFLRNALDSLITDGVTWMRTSLGNAGEGEASEWTYAELEIGEDGAWTVNIDLTGYDFTSTEAGIILQFGNDANNPHQFGNDANNPHPTPEPATLLILGLGLAGLGLARRRK